MQCHLIREKLIQMSLNRYEQTIFNYWQDQPDELRHWKTKVIAVALPVSEPGVVARSLERDLWEYFTERSEYVRSFRDVNAGELRRVSLLNLAEYLLRLWGPLPKQRKPRPL